jgi:fructose-1,6-bisphosphatase/inositol monophosphatase family enzyme
MAIIDLDRISGILRECAQTYIVPRYQLLRDDEISQKTSPRDLVTHADIEAEAFLEKVLPDVYSGTLVLGEEGVSRGDHLMEMLSQDDKPVWVVDPVDGTFNFVQGNPDFGLMLAYVAGGEIRQSWIYDILKDDMYVAEKGSGAYVGSQRLRVSDVRNVPDMRGHISIKFFPKDLQPVIEERVDAFKSSRTIGAAAHEYIRLARGDADVLIYSRLKPWDHLPGALLVREAGGVVRKWDGSEYGVRDLYAGLIVTNSDESWSAVCEAVFDGVDMERHIKKI